MLKRGADKGSWYRPAEQREGTAPRTRLVFVEVNGAFP